LPIAADRNGQKLSHLIIAFTLTDGSRRPAPSTKNLAAISCRIELNGETTQGDQKS